jgi:hypothetical protein
MRSLLVIGLSAFLLASPGISFADSHSTDAVGATAKVIGDNPGKSLGVASCAAIIAFPPAAAWCALTLIGGATIDGDTQKFLDDVTQ